MSLSECHTQKGGGHSQELKREVMMASSVGELKQLDCKRSRHTVEQKRKMRNSRKKRMRRVKAAAKEVPIMDIHFSSENGKLGDIVDQQLVQDNEKEVLKQELANEKAAHEDTKSCVLLNKQMAKTYWERWRHELEECKELQKRNVELLLKHKPSKICSRVHVPRIDRSLLCDPTEFGKCPQPEDVFVGRGSFGVVKVQTYHGITVAVKEFLPRTNKESLEREAEVMCELCHSYLPLLFGVCTLKYPYLLVMQYYGIDLKSVTFRRDLVDCKVVTSYELWIVLCAQLVEAFVYLHKKVGILHNDLKGDNVLITTQKTTNQRLSAADVSSALQVVVIDFGKALKPTDGRKYTLSHSEKLKYFQYHPHIAPELVEGTSCQNTSTDIFSLGKLFMRVAQLEMFRCKTSATTDFEKVAEKAASKIPEKRPTVVLLQEKLANILKLI